jgi:hypothetical protein
VSFAPVALKRGAVLRSGRFLKAAFFEEGFDEGDDGALVVGGQLGGASERGEEPGGGATSRQ